MKRKQCEVTDHEVIESILSRSNIGRLATTDAAGFPYITPVNYVYYKGKIYFHCASVGEKLENIKRDSKACFQVDIPLAYLDSTFSRDGSPCSLHQFYHCVIIRGQARVVEDQQLKLEALNALVKKHETGAPVTQVQADMPLFKACHVVEITPQKTTAKSELAQGKAPEVRRAIAKYLHKRGWYMDQETVEAFGFRAEDI